MANLAAHIAKKRTVRAKITYLYVKMHLVPIKYSPHMKFKMRICHFRSQLSGNVLKLFNSMQAKFVD